MTKSLINRKWFLIAIQVLAWVFIFSLPFLLRPGDRGKGEQRPEPIGFYVSYIVNNLLWVGFFYLNASVFIPKILYRRRLAQFVAIQVLMFGFFLFSGWLNYRIFRGGDHFSFRWHFMFTFFIFLFMLAASTAFKMSIDRIKAEKLADETLNENLKTELSLLRSQVSPHFMFNVLNNMVALARKKSDLLEPSLIKLSSLMRYMLYDVDGEKVSLDKEIEYLESYIDLQKQRVSKQVAIHTDFTAVDRSLTIEPMLLIPFVENAFKHGTGFIENAAIEIVLRTANHHLEFSVRNRFREDEQEIKDNTSGIGLTNVRRRLNLLYGKSHTLTVDTRDDWFNVLLTINLS